MTNRLANESSPYLLQHADNPVNWYPWGEEALEKARQEEKPIFLSIGYAACHWCHVMAHESFEDNETAALLNDHFVSVKVDREERPDLDRIYMTAVQALTGGGGWPMSVFLTPEGEPFYGGTYFPPEPRYGMPSFTDVLRAVADAWENRRPELLEGSNRVVGAIERQMAVARGQGDAVCRPETVETAARNLRQRYDPTNGGWGGAPKFPQPMALEFLLRYHHTTGDPAMLRMVSHALEAMARGGIYDQLGGGFHRYAVDARWVVPHFEKMLYDNAQLARVYLHAWQKTGRPLFRTIAEETLDYVAREMTHAEGSFYATQDADSEGEEGKFYVWTPDEIRDVLGDEADPFIAAYGVTGGGNFEGKNILTFSGTAEERVALAEARQRMLEARDSRIHPGRDEKVLASWNGLMLAAFAEAARTLRRDDYHQIAQRNAEFVLREMMTAQHRLWHTWKDGQAKVNGYLEDHAYLMEGLIELYQTTFDPRWYLAAHVLAEAMIEHFAAPVGFYDTSDDHEHLIVRPRELQDNAVPSGNSMAATALLRLADLGVEPHFEERARQSLCQMEEVISQHPLAFGQWLTALDYAVSRPREIAIVGDLEAADTQALLEVCRSGFRPHQVVAAGEAEGGQFVVPLLRNRDRVDGRATAYVCFDSVCRRPVTDPEGLRRLIEEA
ncbi:MAG: thioredoxin domain-containing protein [Anaerolineae bacterium]|jgi:uncharacterized protein YyaL (SSP411 family)